MSEDTKKIGTEVLVNVILDRSGSMQSRRDATISGYNEYINGLRSDKDTVYGVSLTQFDQYGVGAALTVSYIDRPLADVPDLTAETYEPRGNTPLYDAIGETIRRVGPTANGRAVITVIITDGEENASTEFDKDKIKALIAEKEKEGWTFVFLGCNIDAYAAGGSMGVSAGSTSNFAPSPAGVRAMFATASRQTTERSSAYRMVGAHANRSAFFSDADKDAMNSGVDPNAKPQAATVTNAAKPRDWKRE